MLQKIENEMCCRIWKKVLTMLLLIINSFIIRTYKNNDITINIKKNSLLLFTSHIFRKTFMECLKLQLETI